MAFSLSIYVIHIYFVFCIPTEKELENVVLLGDFNTYQDFEWPLEVFTDTEIRPENSCFDMVRADAKGPNTILADVWSVHAADKLLGFTFSNMVRILF